MQVFRCVRSVSSRCVPPHRFNTSNPVSSFRSSPSSSSSSSSPFLPVPSLFSSFPRSFSSPSKPKSSGKDEIFPGLDEVPGVDLIDNWGKAMSEIKWHKDPPHHVAHSEFKTNVVSIECVRNEEGDLEGVINGEPVIFPEQEPTIEWVLSTPVDLHLFDEVPIVKECPEPGEENSESLPVEQH